jgi:hypothetical protein
MRRLVSVGRWNRKEVVVGWERNWRIGLRVRGRIVAFRGRVLEVSSEMMYDCLMILLVRYGGTVIASH